MKLGSKLTALALAGTMTAVCAVPMTAGAEWLTIDGITYEYNESNPEVSVINCDSSLTEANILSQVKGKPVAWISNNAFVGNANLTSVKIPQSVKNISYYAFRGCTGLTSVTIPYSCAFINYDAFLDCTGLTTVAIPEGCTMYGGAFNGCTALETVTSDGEHPYYFKNSAVYRDNCLMSYANMGETTYTVSEDTAYLGKNAFYKPGTLTDLTILNPDCYIPDTGAIEATVTIHGYDDSTAYRYAMVAGNKFVSLGKSLTTPTTPTSSAGYAPADLDGDGSITASDAALILMYAAYVGAGGTDDIMTFVATL